MERTLGELAVGGAPLALRLRIARALARAVADLHRRGVIHGALSPTSVLVAGDGEAVVLPATGTSGPLALAGYAAPEVIRGGRPSRAADAFAVAALAQLLLAGRGPFDGDGADPLERARRTLFEPPRPVRLDEPAAPERIEEAIALALDRRPRRRGTAEELAAAVEAATATPTPTPTATATATSTSTATVTSTATSALATFAAVVADSPHRLRLAVTGQLRRIPPSPLHRAAFAAAPLLAVALLLLPRSEADLAREVGRDLARGDLAAARTVLDAAPRGTDRALVEKLRGDLACARRVPGECLRRYRTAIAARPGLRADEALRRNVRALLSRDESCATQRSAALLAGELHDPDTLPALQAARRSAGFFAFLCTGDAFDRAIAATRAHAR
jgi:hypothetical protein